MAENVKGFNGVSFGCLLTVDTAMDAAGTVSVDFGSGTALPYPLAFSVLITTTAGVAHALTDADITFNDVRNGVITIADGAVTFTLDDTDIVSIVASYAREV